MNINFGHPASWVNLPVDLQTLLSNVQNEACPYPEREKSWKFMLEYLQAGNFEMARYELEKIQTRQDNLRSISKL
ncbi:MAG: hypothetical protein E6750_18815 [Atlantibacter hermannii]|uniref:hypothetical protein n=1 Tax=Atlantibacter hermannii TaxID=565 RepID=UPI0028FF0FBF|nr:hypothetical protein [Atlantibacter hermannii]MDU1953436.1 hypothetical protein [Atlantibacter hermannii]